MISRMLRRQPETVRRHEGTTDCVYRRWDATIGAVEKTTVMVTMDTGYRESDQVEMRVSIISVFVCFTLTKTFYEIKRSSGKMQQIGACFLTDETIIISSLPFELSKTNVQG